MTDPGNGKRVLIIEDEALIAMNAEDMLGELGWRPIGVSASCQAALKAVDEGGFDIALVDINLRGEDSGPVADALVEAGLPFIFTTGYGQARVPERHHGRVVVTKPYDGKTLDDALEKAIGDG